MTNLTTTNDKRALTLTDLGELAIGDTFLLGGLPHIVRRAAHSDDARLRAWGHAAPVGFSLLPNEFARNPGDAGWDHSTPGGPGHLLAFPDSACEWDLHIIDGRTEVWVATEKGHAYFALLTERLLRVLRYIQCDRDLDEEEGDRLHVLIKEAEETREAATPTPPSSRKRSSEAAERLEDLATMIRHTLEDYEEAFGALETEATAALMFGEDLTPLPFGGEAK